MTSTSVSASVEVDPASLERSTSGAISGRICLRLGSQGFPEKSWNDLPVAVVHIWLEALRTLRAGKTAEAECPFLDGPFLVRVHPASKAWRVECLNNRTPAQVELVQADELWNSLIKAGRVLVDECNRKAWRGREIVELGHLLSVLARERAV